MADEIRRAPNRRQARPTPHEEVAERGRAGGRDVEARAGRCSTRLEHWAADGKHLPALCLGLLDSVVEEEASATSNRPARLARPKRSCCSATRVTTTPGLSGWRRL